jgi:hypothetical protein
LSEPGQRKLTAENGMQMLTGWRCIHMIIPYILIQRIQDCSNFFDGGFFREVVCVKAQLII